MQYALTAVLLLFSLTFALVSSQSHRRCPLGCKCDFEGTFKRVRCEITDSSVNINFNDVDPDIQFLEVLPRQRGRTDAFGPALPDAFLEFPNLERLVIRNNGIQRIPASSARQLNRLNTLDLAGNEIRSLRDLALDNLDKLQSLQLSSNGITEVTDDSLRPLRNLKLFALNSNQIRSISAGAFRSQQYLEHLELRNNQLQDVPSSVFDNSIRLSYLDLSSNQLSAVPVGVMRLFGLGTILLDNNKITTVSSQQVQAWRSSEVLEDISLYGNPLICDDSLRDFIDWVKTKDGGKKACDIQGRGGQETSGRSRCPACQSPRSVAGQTVDVINPRDLGFQGDQPSRGQLNTRPTANSRPSDQDFVSFQVTDSVKVPTGFDPRRDAQRPALSSVQTETLAKLKQFMPGAGVRCGQRNCYYFSAKGTNQWRTAEYICQSIGLDLAEISSASEQREVMQFLIDAVKENPQRSSPSRGWWIGFKYNTQAKSVISASSGRPVSFSNWASGQPNNFASGEECVELWDTGDWNDGRCSLTAENQFICQSPLSVGQGLSTQSSPNSGSSGRKTSSGSASSRGSSSFDTVSFTVNN